jgi:hypothetical protein
MIRFPLKRQQRRWQPFRTSGTDSLDWRFSLCKLLDYVVSALISGSMFDTLFLSYE